MDLKSMGKYFLGVVLGISLVVSCGGGGGSSPSVANTNAAAPTDQMLCSGSVSIPGGITKPQGSQAVRAMLNGSAGNTVVTIDCSSKLSGTAVGRFTSFNAIASAGWTLTSIDASTLTMVFQK